MPKSRVRNTLTDSKANSSNAIVKISRLSQDTLLKYKVDFPILEKNDFVFIRGKYPCEKWLSARISEVPPSMQENGCPIFKVESLENTSAVARMHVQGNKLAMGEAPTQRVPVKTRVIATKGKDEYFFIGIVAKGPIPANQNRYLIIFDDWSAHYCTKWEIRQIYWQLKDVTYDVLELNKEGIRNFLNRPKRECAMKVLHTGDQILYIHNGESTTATVLTFDHEIVALEIKGEDYTWIKWVHRGDPNILKVLSRTIHSALRSNSLLRSRGFGTAFCPKMILNRTKKEKQKKRTFDEVTETSQHLVPFYNVISPQHTLDIHFYKPLSDLHKQTTFPPLLVPELLSFNRTVEKDTVQYVTPGGMSLTSLAQVMTYINSPQGRETNMSIDQFCFDPDVKTDRMFSVRETFIQIEDYSLSKELIRISCVNEYNKEKPSAICYLTKCLMSKETKTSFKANNEIITPCSCENDCMDSENCSCHQMTMKAARDFNGSTAEVGYQYKRLYDKVYSGIFECHSGCPCSHRCQNRVAQLLSSNPLQLFMTKRKGWGVRTLHDIPRGAFVCNYIGELITSEEAEQRGKVYGDRYLAELDHIEVMEKFKEEYEAEQIESDDESVKSDDQSSDPDFMFKPAMSSTMAKDNTWETRLRVKNQEKREINEKQEQFKLNVNKGEEPMSLRQQLFGPDQQPYIVDSQRKGNIARFFNHSCAPNMFVQTVFINTRDLRFPGLAFFTSEHVPAGTELTWDYGYDLDPRRNIECYCESKSCRKRLL